MLLIKHIYEEGMGDSFLLCFVLGPVVLFFSILFSPCVVFASVTGICSNCHTMHNSQGGQPVYTGGPAPTLLVNSCVGCHSSDTTETKIDIGGGTIVPIVYNSLEPAKPLAGGNFYWVEDAGHGDRYGHNVYGISEPDVTLTTAPGSIYCANSCHTSLALAAPGNGCQGCHNYLKHHGTDPASGDPENNESGWYRFLSAPLDSEHLGNGGGPVNGIESSDWEYEPSATNHNVYYKGTGSDLGDIPESMGKFCGGCHAKFHSPGFETIYTDNGSGASESPWLRHPADYAMPDAGEFANAAGGIIGMAYDPLVPVGKPVPLGAPADAEVVKEFDTVMCLSCHRAHGSPYEHMLRWEGNNMRTGATGGTDAHEDVIGTGCFKCHSAKD